MSKFPTNRDMYRVSLNHRTRPHLAKVELVGINFVAGGIDPLSNGWYASDVLPDWMQRKLAVLYMVRPDQSVDGVGKRISDDIFWVEGNDED